MAIKYSWPLHLPRDFADKHTFITMLKSFANSGNIQQGMHVHALITQSDILLDPFLCNTLLSMYAKCGLLHDAAKVLDMMPERNNVTWTVIITCHAKHGHHDRTLALYKRMVSLNLMPNEVILVCVVNACTCQKALADGKNVHMTICECGLESDTIVASSLVNMYAKHAYLMDAQKVFDKMLDRTVVTWTSIIAGYTDHGFAEEAMCLFGKMIYEGAKPDQVTFMSILKACTFMGALERGKQYHVIIINADLKQNITLDNALVNMYAKCGRLDTSNELFQRMEKRDVASWSMVIAGCVENGQPKTALEYFKRMQAEMVKPNYVTLIGVLKACTHFEFLKEGQLIHHYVIEDNIWEELNVICALIDMYTKCGQIRDAYQVFHNSARKDVVLWTAMISGYAQQGLNEEALEIYAKMLVSGVKANMVTFVSVLSACACLAAIKQGTHIHEQICKNGLDTTTEVCAALINLYSKCGLLLDARRIFDRMRVRSVITWTTMVTAYAQHGHGRKAIELVDEMRQGNLKLDHVSLVGVIAACNSEGLVHEASHLVDSMCKDHGFVPSTKHYVCMADALGRAGQLKEAEIILKSMPFQPNAIAWRSFLGAWKNRDGSKLVDSMADRAFPFEPQSADDFVLLSNVCGAAAVREEQNKGAMKRLGM